MEITNIEELIQDNDFIAKVTCAKSLDAVEDLLREKGIEISTAEMKAVMRVDEELSEDALDNIAGGGWLLNWLSFLVQKRSEKNKKELDKLVKTINKK